MLESPRDHLARASERLTQAGAQASVNGQLVYLHAYIAGLHIDMARAMRDYNIPLDRREQGEG